jgi:nitronate monooxygenase
MACPTAKIPPRRKYPFPRVLALRMQMREYVTQIKRPIVMAGRRVCFSVWTGLVRQTELGPIAFQFGTRPLVSEGKPDPQAWEDKQRTIKKVDVVFKPVSPTGFITTVVLQQVHGTTIRRLERKSIMRR